MRLQAVFVLYDANGNQISVTGGSTINILDSSANRVVSYQYTDFGEVGETKANITQDSYRGEENDEDTWHLYAYCANNPINYVDPRGHKTENK